MPKRMMVVDDDRVSRTFMKKVLEAKGYEVEAAEDGLDALAKVVSFEPDIIILDIMMPEVNGYDVCYQLRFNKKYEQIPIVLVTARDAELDNSIGERVNIEYLHKPVNPTLLLDKVERLLLRLS